MTTERLGVELGDCLKVMQGMRSGTIDLIYMDPPFFTGKVHKLKTRNRTKEFSFSDIWNGHRDYGEFLFDRLVEMHRLLSDRGNIFVHCDRSASHLIRAILDDLFGAERFHSEIIWSYRRWSNGRKGLLPAHQTIFFYSKFEKNTFNILYGKYSESTNVDQVLQKRVRDEQGKAVYARDEAGEIIPSDAKKGVPLSDVWEIPYLNPKAKERVGYPTQKPLLLLERILEVGSNEGDLVLDPFCGSGTALVAAKRLKRRAIGIDTSKDAVELTLSRLECPTKSESRLLEKGRAFYLTADSKGLGLLQGLDLIPVHRNAGIDAILRQQYQNRPVPVRIQKDNEPLVDAVLCLSKAARKKRAVKARLVQTGAGSLSDLGGDLPSEVVVVRSPALEVEQVLKDAHTRWVTSGGRRAV